MSEQELLEQLTEHLSKAEESGGPCPSGVIKLHTEFLMGIKKDLKDISESVKRSETISVINGNEDGTPTEYKRDTFYQMLYNNGVKKVLGLEDCIANVYKEIENINKRNQNHSFRNSFFNLSKWASAAIPILFLLALALMFLGYSHLATQIAQLNK